MLKSLIAKISHSFYEQEDPSWQSIKEKFEDVDEILFAIKNFQYYCQEDFVPTRDVKKCEELLREHRILSDLEKGHLNFTINVELMTFLTIAIELSRFCEFIKDHEDISHENSAYSQIR